MPLFRLIGSIVLLTECLILVSGELKCDKNQYKDGATNICMPCNACCPPRPQNQYCTKGCDLKEACKVAENPNLQTWQIVLIAFLILLVVVIVMVVVTAIYRKNIGRALRRFGSKRNGVLDTSHGDPRQCQVIGGDEADSPPLTNGPSVPTRPLINNNLNADVAFQENPSRNQFHSIPSSHLRIQDRVSTPFASLPIPAYLESNGVKYIREDIAMMSPNDPLVEAQFRASLNCEASDEAIGLLPSAPSCNHSRTTPQLNGKRAGANPEENLPSMIKSVQCAEDLEYCRPVEIYQDETPVKT